MSCLTMDCMQAGTLEKMGEIDDRQGKYALGISEATTEHYEDWAHALNETVKHSLTMMDDVKESDLGDSPGRSPDSSVIGNVLRIHDQSEEHHSPVTKALLTNMKVQAPAEATGLEDLTHGDEIYEGQFKDGEPNVKHGHGKLKLKKGKSEYVYDGEFEENKKTGKGVMRWGDGRVYRGTFLKDKIHGEGIMTWPDGRRYVGQYENNLKHGTGIFYFKEDGRQHQGQWRNGKRHGPGVYTNEKEEEICGHWHEDKPIEETMQKVPQLERSDQGLLMASKKKGH
eukprot:gnl/MRDRNA2_/MRDRNA2_139726_c0_seq1.p1 gnl/MRDRNA2_/MRDRNA2_139726_c0~~gnl/MRDRNA2_/MRDRNA2_139726_c0_seq1.p1  ORF type:complete len:283 (+),score=60.81 gnl/MRDRNA2_/MRDRNA2_139726_c0_seq1:106-954(+)